MVCSVLRSFVLLIAGAVPAVAAVAVAVVGCRHAALGAATAARGGRGDADGGDCGGKLGLVFTPRLSAAVPRCSTFRSSRPNRLIRFGLFVPLPPLHITNKKTARAHAALRTRREGHDPKRAVIGVRLLTSCPPHIVSVVQSVPCSSRHAVRPRRRVRRESSGGGLYFGGSPHRWKRSEGHASGRAIVHRHPGVVCSGAVYPAALRGRRNRRPRYEGDIRCAAVVTTAIFYAIVRLLKIVGFGRHHGRRDSCRRPPTLRRDM